MFVNVDGHEILTEEFPDNLIHLYCVVKITCRIRLKKDYNMLFPFFKNILNNKTISF